MCNSVVFSVVNVEKAGQNARLMSNNKGEWCWLASWQAQWDSGDEVNTFTLLVSGSRLCHAALGLQGWEEEREAGGDSTKTSWRAQTMGGQCMPGPTHCDSVPGHRGKARAILTNSIN